MGNLVIAVCAVAGFLSANILDALVDRAGRHQPFGGFFRTCSSCGAPGEGWRKVPLIGTLMPARSCPGCSRPSPRLRALALGVTTSAILGAFAWRFGTDVALAAFAVLAVALVTLSAVDLERTIIPNRIVYPALFTCSPLLVLASWIDHRWHSLATAAIGGSVAFAAFFALHVAIPKGLGFGDVRLAGLIGTVTGWLGLGHEFVAFFAAFVTGAVIGLGFLIVTRKGRKTRIPFGPFMALGAVVGVIWGSSLANLLLHHQPG